MFCKLQGLLTVFNVKKPLFDTLLTQTMRMLCFITNLGQHRGCTDTVSLYLLCLN